MISDPPPTSFITLLKNKIEIQSIKALFRVLGISTFSIYLVFQFEWHSNLSDIPIWGTYTVWVTFQFKLHSNLSDNQIWVTYYFKWQERAFQYLVDKKTSINGKGIEIYHENLVMQNYLGSEDFEINYQDRKLIPAQNKNEYQDEV